MYTGCLENQHGFYPLRDPKSKWFISYEEMPDSAVRSPAGCWPERSVACVKMQGSTLSMSYAWFASPGEP